MARITEIIVEPSTIYIQDRFKIKVKVDDYYKTKRVLITEDGHPIITEDGNLIRTEWGE